MSRIIWFVLLSAAVEFVVTGVVSGVITFFVVAQGAVLKNLLFFIFINSMQIIARMIMGNYIFSWMLMKYLLRKKIPWFFVGTINLLCTYLVIFLFIYLFGNEFEIGKIVFNIPTGISMFIGIYVTSIIMAKYLGVESENDQYSKSDQT
ncbi:hypothetical protein A9Q81_11975 [Gammaproteobacteria bacterium 42_54_T18]|nr:hypothetical protein A9Q81_11975 [Gammaproteobacteria bacterium 42_54_T18]